MESFASLIKNESLQDRINRMNAWKDARKKADEEYIRQQRIRMFINDCDDIRPSLRNQLLIDSKVCQLEQIKDLEKRVQQIKDIEDNWHQVLKRDNFSKTEMEKSKLTQRRYEGLTVQDYLKSQMYEKSQTDAQKMHEEINLELEQISISKKEEAQQDEERMKKQEDVRKKLNEEITKQIHRNDELKKNQKKKELELEKILNKKIENDMIKEENARRSDQEHFRSEVFHYLDYLRKTRHQNDIEQCEKEKLIDDIRKKRNENEWIQRCEFVKKRELVNQQARSIQVHQIIEQDKMKIRDAAKEREDNLKFNERELNERMKIREEKWNDRVKAHHYGQELLEQKKMEHLRDMAEKQKLDEQLKLFAIERDQRETMGREFIKSFEDVLPIHSNLLVIRKGKAHN
ncbi:hypothetical protein ACKWTF_006475 [Chironomus riparius]